MINRNQTDSSCWNFALNSLTYRDKEKETVNVEEHYQGLSDGKKRMEYKQTARATDVIKEAVEALVNKAGFVRAEGESEFAVCAMVQKTEEGIWPVFVDHWYLKAYGWTIETWTGWQYVQIGKGSQQKQKKEYIVVEVPVVGLTKTIVPEFCLPKG